MPSSFYPAFAALLAAVSALPFSASAQDGGQTVDFAHDILPLIKTHCAKCHTDGTYKNGFSMDTREAMLESESVVPGKSAESDLIALLTAEDPVDRMPQKSDPLTDAQVALFKAWIDQELPWEEGFSFKASTWEAPLEPRKPELPEPGAWGDHPIDRLVAGYLQGQNVALPERIDDATFMRRLQLDLLGLLPDADRLKAFVDDTASDKRRRLVEESLERNVDYADHWLTFWNDLLRNDYAGTGYIDGGRKQVTAWLYESLRENKPYDVFVRELINPSSESEGFIKGIKWRGNVNASQRQEVQFAQSISQVFLGENMKCASCHDSFINDWKLKDAYGLAAIIAEEPLEIHRCDKATGEMAQAAFLFPELGEIDAQADKQRRLAQTAELMTSPRNGRLARTLVNRLWQRLMGRGLVEPVDIMGNRPWNEDLLDFLASDLAENDYDIKHILALITTSRSYQSACVPPPGEDVAPEDYIFKGPIAKRMTAEQFVDAVWKITGQAPEKPEAASTDAQERDFVRASLVVSDSLMRALGRPNREQIVTTRPAELSTLQALELNNGQAFASLLSAGAAKLEASLESRNETAVEGLITRLYLEALSRKPASGELQLATDIVGRPVTTQGLADLLWTMFMLPEFQIIH